MKKTWITQGIIAASVLAASTAFAGIQTVTTNTSATYAKTKFPIVFVPGMFGFTTLGPNAFGMDYWYKVLPNLAANGATVYATQISPLNSTEIRGEQLIAQLEEVMAITGAQKLNLIGHSHGGPTSRYAAAFLPNKIASISTVGGVNKGSKVSDLVLSNGVTSAVVAAFVNATIAPTLNFFQGNTSLPNDMEASLRAFSTAESAAFNQRFPDGIPTTSCGEGAYVSQGVYNYSWTGSGVITNVLDGDTAVVSLNPLAYGLTSSDGLVGTCSTHFGKVIRDNYYLNHTDEINQIMGLRGLFSPDPVELYRQHANRLKIQGL